MKKLIYNNCGLFSVIWAITILLLCSTPGQFIPSVSWLELLSFDKWVHASIFFGLSTLLFIVAIKKAQSVPFVFIYLFSCIAYGGLLEIMQAKLFSHRSGDWLDFIANSFGCFVAVLFYKKLKIVFSALK